MFERGHTKVRVVDSMLMLQRQVLLSAYLMKFPVIARPQVSLPGNPLALERTPNSTTKYERV